MTHNDIMVLAWPAIGVAAMCLFGWFMSRWIDRTYPRKSATSAAVTNGTSPSAGPFKGNAMQTATVVGVMPAADPNRGPEPAEGLDQLRERLARLQADSTRNGLDIKRIEVLIEEKNPADQSLPSP
ncbi:hypothetical protein [Rhodopseudomonas palustris]